MTRPGFAGGVLAAAMLAAAAAALSTALTPALGLQGSLRAVVVVIGFAYVCYLLTLARWRAGALTSLVVWAAVSIGAAWTPSSTATLFLVQAGLIWGIRSLYLHDGVLTAAADLLLTIFAIAFAAAAAERTGSLALATWSFFLVQAAFCAIPALPTATTRPRPTREFDRAARRAANAARALKTRTS